MQTPDPSEVNINLIKDIRNQLADLHLNLFRISTLCHHPGLGNRYHDVGCRVEGITKSAVLVLGVAIEELVQVENELFNERSNNDPN